jgi:hypothetical protein
MLNEGANQNIGMAPLLYTQRITQSCRLSYYLRLDAQPGSFLGALRAFAIWY